MFAVCGLIYAPGYLWKVRDEFEVIFLYIKFYSKIGFSEFREFKLIF